LAAAGITIGARITAAAPTARELAPNFKLLPGNFIIYLPSEIVRVMLEATNVRRYCQVINIT
jgi:hypothetical protein